jgi:prolyl oligopeptidase
VLDKKEVTVGGDGAASGTVVDGTLYLYTNQGAPNGRVFAVDPRDPRRETWKEIVPERSDAVIQDVSVARGLLVVEYLRNATSAFEVFRLDGTPAGSVRLPGLGTASIAVEPDRTEAYVAFESFNHPDSIFRVDLARPDAEPELWEQPEVPVDPALVEVEQVWYPSKDGTRISRRRSSRPPSSRGSRRAPSTPCPTCAAAASTATTGTRRACSSASRPCSTTSRRPPNG